MLNKKSVDDINVKGKKVLVRCDFNVPLQDGGDEHKEGADRHSHRDPAVADVQRSLLCTCIHFNPFPCKFLILRCCWYRYIPCT